MSHNTLLVLQSVGITVHILNAGLATVTHNALIALLIGAVAGGFQYFLQNVGNKSDSNAHMQNTDGNSNSNRTIT